jgi:uncharacterized membrane protein YfbV (UPF0208 family)
MWLFILKYWKPLSAVLAVLIVMGGLYWYGATKYREGYNAATVHWQEIVRMAQMEARQERDEISKKVKRLSDPDIDKQLADNQWLRSDEDY